MQRVRMSSDEWLTIGEVAEMIDVQPSTLRYYESIGLLPRVKRVSGQRRYSPSILPLLAIIQMAKEAGFSLPEIHALLHTQSDGEALSQRWQTLAAAKISELDQVISRAQEMKTLLQEALSSDALHFELDQVDIAEKPNLFGLPPRQGSDRQSD